MKFYSEKLDKLFDTQEELQSAEGIKTKKKTTTKTTETSQETVVPTRKELAEQVELADAKVKEAYANYESAKLEVEELSKQYLSKINDILEPARKAVKDAEKLKYEAIRNFNDSYGSYQVTYTGAKAADEFQKAVDNINARAGKIFKDFFWFN